MEKKEVASLEKRIDLLVKLMAYQIISGKSLTEGAPILRRIGLTATEIADIYDTTSNTVNVRLSASKKKSKRQPKKGKNTAAKKASSTT